MSRRDRRPYPLASSSEIAESWSAFSLRLLFLRSFPLWSICPLNVNPHHRLACELSGHFTVVKKTYDFGFPSKRSILLTSAIYRWHGNCGNGVLITRFACRER